MLTPKYALQLGIDIGSSTVAREVVSLVLGYLNNLVIEMAFLVQVKVFMSFKLLQKFHLAILMFTMQLFRQLLLHIRFSPSYFISEPH